MHLDDITAALASRDMATIKEAFLALANYPKEDCVRGLTAGNAMTFLEAAAEALRADYSPMPRHTCEAVLDNRQTWADHFAMIFRAH